MNKRRLSNYKRKAYAPPSLGVTSLLLKVD
jgi:hypothetical protein